ncbi:MAG: signal peptide peptidase SppA [Haemophilus parainfluenzae]|nr:signal peptide peptidase SppA [Haemophilus parainfluenzae]
MISVLKFCCKALNFIRNLVMNFVFLLFVLALIVLASLFSDGKKNQVLSGDQGALYLNLTGYLADNTEDMLSWQEEFQRLNNEKVSYKYSTFDVVFEGGDLPSLEYVGKAIQSFKESEKPVIAYADNYTQAQYFLASFADDIYLNPIGQVGIQGLRQENLYFKSMLEKLEITPHIFRVGTYKSAVEPFLRDDMSPEAKANMQKWLGGMWQNYMQTLMINRHITANDVLPSAQKYISDLKALKGDETAYVKKRQLVTQFATRLDLDKKLTALFGQGEEGKAKLVDFEDYLSDLGDRFSVDPNEKNIVAVVNVEGTIIDGESDEESRQAYDNEKVKAVVLRVNSPGGSAFASEIIRQETENLQKAGKPVVVSMGGMAASGGYWISSTADYIVADKNTITGSIGIFALFPTFENTIKKMGMSTDGVATTDLAETSALSPLGKNTQDIYQLSIENGYDRFLDVVSRGRQLSKDKVDKIAQGQVWLGQDAQKNGLVDELGDIDIAIDKVVALVNQHPDKYMDNFSVQWLVDEDNSFLAKLDRKLKQKGQALLTNWLGLPQEVHQVKKQLNVLTKFNDPKGQYLYCLNCGSVK